MANPLSRREVLKYGAFTTVGGVLTPGISLAQAITTESRGMTARDIQLQSGGTTIPAYDARPEAAGRYPILVVISGFTGNSEQHKDVVRRFAQAGYYAIAPELFSREGGMQGKNFVDFKPGDIVIGELNPNYHLPNRPYFDTIEMKGGGDATSAARAVLQTGEYDYAWNMQVEDEILKRLEQGGRGKVDIWSAATSSTSSATSPTRARKSTASAPASRPPTRS